MKKNEEESTDGVYTECLYKATRSLRGKYQGLIRKGNSPRTKEELQVGVDAEGE